MTRTLFLLATAIILSNCASSNSDGQLTETDIRKHVIICTKEKPTGSHLPVTVCRSQEQIDEETKQAKELILENKRENRR